MLPSLAKGLESQRLSFLPSRSSLAVVRCLLNRPEVNFVAITVDVCLIDINGQAVPTYRRENVLLELRTSVRTDENLLDALTRQPKQVRLVRKVAIEVLLREAEGPEHSNLLLIGPMYGLVAQQALEEVIRSSLCNRALGRVDHV